MTENKASRFGLNICSVFPILVAVVVYVTSSQVNAATGNNLVLPQSARYRNRRSDENDDRCPTRYSNRNTGTIPQLTKEYIQVEFINRCNTYTARVKWSTPKVNTTVQSYFLYWIGSFSISQPKCVMLKNTTNTYDIQESKMWKGDNILYIAIAPQPSSMPNKLDVVSFTPVYNNNCSYPELQTTTSYTKSSKQKTPSSSNEPSKVIPTSGKSVKTPARVQHGDHKGDAEGIKIVYIVAVCLAGVAIAVVLLGLIVFYYRRRIHGYKLTPVIAGVDKKKKKKDYFYVSYCPENECLIKNVVEFTSWFRQQGYDVQLDILQSPNNEAQLKELGPFRFGEKQLGNAKNVFMILSASYLRLCKLDEEGEIGIENLSRQERIVYSEITQIRNELCSTVYRNSRFIPVIFGVKEIELPFWIKELVVYTWPDDKLNNRLLYRLNEQMEYALQEKCGDEKV